MQRFNIQQQLIHMYNTTCIGTRCIKHSRHSIYPYHTRQHSYQPTTCTNMILLQHHFSTQTTDFKPSLMQRLQLKFAERSKTKEDEFFARMINDLAHIQTMTLHDYKIMQSVCYAYIIMH